jgi:protein phosphatase
MATALVGVATEKDKAIFTNVGDSRGYLIRNSRLRQITHDHEDFMGAITRVVGYLPEVEPDTFNISLKKDDLLLLCTDGLSDILTDEQILGVVKKTENNQKALIRKAKELVEAAKTAGGPDNITVCLIKRT